MNRVGSVKLWTLLALAPLAMAACYVSSAAAQKAADKARRQRLPNYYAQVVTDEQREEIYTIQDEYTPQITKLRQQLKTLIEKRDGAIEKVLTAKQRQEVEKLRADAAARRSGEKTATDGPSEAKSDAKKSNVKAKKAA